jgi:oxygen-independent coproporphyrinogen-3 oxidase
MPSLYIHIPFCASICNYCDFSAIPAPERLHGEYVSLALQELKLRANESDFETVYLGGGSPSALSMGNLQKLLAGLQASKLKEFSMEWNPEQASEEKIKLALDFGINRFSLGIQSLNDDMLKMLGRNHSAKTALNAYEKLSKNFNTGNCDLMFCLPNQSTELFMNDIKTLINLNAKHISFYGLTLENNCMMKQQIRKKKLPPPPEDLYPEKYSKAAELLETAGLMRYEVSNFAAPCHESRHNMAYWQRKPYLGIGPSAHSYLQGIRYSAPKNYSPWSSWIKAGCPEKGLNVDIPSENGKEIEAVWLALRTREGLSLSGYELEFGKKFNLNRMEPFIKSGWLALKGDYIHLSGQGWLWLDKIFLHF